MQRFQVSFIGLSTLFGKTSSLLLKQSPFIKCIKLYDESNIDPALDVAGMNTQCKVKAFLGKEQLKSALKNADIIVIGEDAYSETCCDGDIFTATAPKVLDYAKAIASTAPEAIVVVAASPVNSMMPLLTEMLVHQGCYNSNKVLGATTLDNVRANSLLASYLKIDAQNVVLPVIGGSSEETRVPVFSQAKPKTHLSQEIKELLTTNIKTCDSEIMKYKKSPESLNKAYATMRFLNNIMAGLRGEVNVTDITLTKTKVVPGVEYFALPVVFGRDGIVQRFGIPALSPMEQEMVNNAITNMKKDVDKASLFWKEGSYITKQFAMSSENQNPRKRETYDFNGNFTQTKDTKKVEHHCSQNEKLGKNENDTTATLSESEKFNSSKETTTTPKENVLSGFVYQSKRKINNSFEETGDGPISFRPISDSASLNICQPLKCPIDTTTKPNKITQCTNKINEENSFDQVETDGIHFSKENNFTINRNSSTESKRSALRNYKKQKLKSRDVQAQADQGNEQNEQNLTQLVKNTEKIINESTKFTLGTKKIKDNKQFINSQSPSNTKNGSNVKQGSLFQQFSAKSKQAYNNDINIINKPKGDKSSGKKEKSESAYPDVPSSESSYMLGITEFAKQIRNQYNKFALNKQKTQSKGPKDNLVSLSKLKEIKFSQQLKSQKQNLKIFDEKKQSTTLPFPQPHQYGVNKKITMKSMEFNKNLPFFEKLHESENSILLTQDKKSAPTKQKNDHPPVLKKKDSLLQSNNSIEDPIDEIEKPLRDYICIKSFFAKKKDNSEKPIIKGKSLNKNEKVSIKRDNSDADQKLFNVVEESKNHEQTIPKEMKAETSRSPKRKRTKNAEKNKVKGKIEIEEKSKSEDLELKKPSTNKRIFGKFANNLTRYSVAARTQRESQMNTNKSPLEMEEKLTLRDQAKVFVLQDLNKKTNTDGKLHLSYKSKSSASQKWKRHRSEKIANGDGKKETPEPDSLKSTVNVKSKTITKISDISDEIVIKEEVTTPKVKTLFQVLSANKAVKEINVDKHKEINLDKQKEIKLDKKKEINLDKQKEIEPKVEINDKNVTLAKDSTVVESSIKTPIKTLLQMLPVSRKHYVKKKSHKEYLKKEGKDIDTNDTIETNVYTTNKMESKILEAKARKQAKLIQDHVATRNRFHQQYLQQKYSEGPKQNLKVKNPTYKLLSENKVINISEDSKRLDSDNDLLQGENIVADTTSKNSAESVNVPSNQKLGYNDLKNLVKSKVSTLQKTKRISQPAKSSAEISNSTPVPKDSKAKEPDVVINETKPVTNDIVIINKSVEKEEEQVDLNQIQNDVKITPKQPTEVDDSKLKSVLRHLSNQKEKTMKQLKNNTISWKINEKMKLNYRQGSPSHKMMRNRINTSIRNLKFQKPLAYNLKNAQSNASYKTTKTLPTVKPRSMQPFQGIHFYKTGSQRVSEKEKRYRILNNFLSPNYMKRQNAEQKVSSKIHQKLQKAPQKGTRVSVTVPLYGTKPKPKRSKLPFKQKNKKKNGVSKFNQLKSNYSNKAKIKEEKEKPFIRLSQNIFEFDRSNIEKQKNLYLRPCKVSDDNAGTSADSVNPFKNIPPLNSTNSSNVIFSLPNSSGSFKTPVGSLSFYKDFIKTSESKVNEYNCKLGILPSLKSLFNESRV